MDAPVLSLMCVDTILTQLCTETTRMYYSVKMRDITDLAIYMM